jgi:hypothetical protein
MLAAVRLLCIPPANVHVSRTSIRFGELHCLPALYSSFPSQAFFYVRRKQRFGDYLNSSVHFICCHAKKYPGAFRLLGQNTVFLTIF